MANLMNIIFPHHDSLVYPVNYSSEATLISGKVVHVEATIPTSCLKKDGTIKAAICRLLRHPSTENKIKLRLKYGVDPHYTFMEEASSAKEEVLA